MCTSRCLATVAMTTSPEFKDPVSVYAVSERANRRAVETVSFTPQLASLQSDMESIKTRLDDFFNTTKQPQTKSVFVRSISENTLKTTTSSAGDPRVVALEKELESFGPKTFIPASTGLFQTSG